MSEVLEAPSPKKTISIKSNSTDGNSKAVVSTMASGLIGSEILKIGADVRAMTAKGEKICNLTVGDFNPKYFPIPELLREEIMIALTEGETNYPPSDGMPDLRRAVQDFYKSRLGLDYPIESIIITGGARPAIYGTYVSLVDPGEKVVYPVPSWNNNHYCHLVGATDVPVSCSFEDQFLPTAKSLEKHLQDARLLSLCSPLNPTGTAFTKEALESICDLILRENDRRAITGARPLFLMYDQVYWMLTFGSTKHYNPVSLRPEMKKYTIFIDGISKAFAATGVRVGWAVAPPAVAQTMSNILGHVGAWAPRAEQVGVAKFLANNDAIERYHESMLSEVNNRLHALYEGFQTLKNDHPGLDAIHPMGAIYLTAKCNLTGKRTPEGDVLNSNETIRKYLLRDAKLAIVPFEAFGPVENPGWFRLSVGAVSMEEIQEMLPRLHRAIDALK